MKKYQKFFDTKVWQDTHDLTLFIYTFTKKQFPKSELFGLTSQIQRSSSSMGSNIAEGFEQQSQKAKLSYLNIAKASCLETQNHALLAKDLEYISPEQCDEIMIKCDNILHQLGGWMKQLK